MLEALGGAIVAWEAQHDSAPVSIDLSFVLP